jgi:signal transduction histidine kinase
MHLPHREIDTRLSMPLLFVCIYGLFLCISIYGLDRFRESRLMSVRYKFDGVNENRQDGGDRRKAFYNSLRPRDYTFRVTASNQDGVWNEEGATSDFLIAPAWYQTTAFMLLCFVAGFLIVLTLFRLRVRQIEKTVSAKFDERLAERTRIARELHDTFLQTVQGSKMVADDALEHSGDPIRMRRALEKLSDWLGQATQEGRAALNSLRTSTTQTNDLAEAFQRATETCLYRGSPTATISIAGEPRDMHPIVRDEIYRIGYEAIRNACAHSGAGRLKVELRYEYDLIVRVKDDGKGIDDTIAAHGKVGHFGLQGMRERAFRIGAEFTLASSATTGTEITLVVPGGVAFRTGSHLD